MYRDPRKMLVRHKMILGNLPFLGISYQGKQRDEQLRNKFSSKDEIKKVMKTAIDYDVRIFSASAHMFNSLAQIYLQAVKEVEDEEGMDIQLIPCLDVPLRLRGRKLNDYKRWKTHVNYESETFGKSVTQRVLEDPILNCRPNWKENLQLAKPYRMKDLQRELRIDWNLWERNIDAFSEYHIAWIEPGSETDFLAISRMDLLEELLDVTREAGYRTLLGSHHLGVSFPLVEEGRVKRFDGYVTPVNKLGIMMFPTQKAVENAVRKARKQGKLIVGIKPLAGGRIKPQEALSYVYKEIKADACMIGVSSVDEAKEDFETAQKLLTS